MKIRTRLALIFFVLVIIVVSVFSLSIYFFSANYRESDFYRRLRNRAVNTAVVLIQFDEIDAELLKKMEKENPASLPDQFVRIYDPKGAELYSSDSERVMQRDTAMLSAIAGGKEYQLEKGRYEILGFPFTHEENQFIIIAGATDVHGLDALNNLRRIIAATFGISVVFVSILGWVYAGRVLRPISRIVREVDSITEVNLGRRLDEGNRKDELSKLAQTFNNMLGRLQAAFEAQKTFIANASHELKTPFTVMAGEIEVTLLQPRDNAYYKRILESVLDGIRRFNKLSTQLLLLAQANSDQPRKRFALLRIDDILWDAKNELLRLHPEYNIEILFDLALDPESLTVNGDEQLLKALVMNLMDNGCKYGDENAVVIRLTAVARRNAAHRLSIDMEFVNRGPGIPRDDLQRIFEPFFRGKSNVKVKGFGIGLSLAKRIAALHMGEITVSSVPREETSFRLILPAANPAA